jgi:hypothetical protein
VRRGLPAAPGAPLPETPGGTSRRKIWLVGGAGLAAIAIGLWLVAVKLPRWLGAPSTDQSAAGAPGGPDGRRIHATIFYVSTDGHDLVPTDREVPYGATPGEQARRILEAQFGPAPAGLVSPIPPGTTVRALYLTPSGEAYVDLSHDIVAAHPGGSLAEAQTVFAIVDALTVNLPDISGVQLLVDGKEVDTLAGHLDLRHPLHRTLKWIRKGS